MFVTRLLYSVIEDTTSGCKIKKNSTLQNFKQKNLQNFFWRFEVRCCSYNRDYFTTTRLTLLAIEV